MRSALALALALCACGDETDATPAEASGCPERGDCYTAGLSRTGDAGLTVQFVDAEPAPPSRGDNRWVFEVRDGETPLAGCQITVVPLMPDHGHGTNTDAVVTALGEGRYQAEPLDLFMRGLWTVDLAITCDARSDDVQFSFWIEG